MVHSKACILIQTSDSVITCWVKIENVIAVPLKTFVWNCITCYNCALIRSLYVLK